MNIEIIGTQFINKGAELMLLAIIDQLKKRNKDIDFCMEPHPYFSPYKNYAPLGIYSKLPHNKRGINFGSIYNLIPFNIKKTFGHIKDSEINIYLDASGFQYSDQWGENSARKLATSIKKWKRQGSKVILLPQAFGSFKSEKLQKHMNIIIEYADIIFAREETSYNYLKSINDNNNILMAPDFTNLISVNLDENSEYKNKICIVPNKRMIDKTKNTNNYIKALREIINELTHHKIEYFFLIHEGKEDKSIINQLQLTKAPEIVETNDALEIKKIIGESKGMIGSRFHGLVSSLSQGKPVIALGWSHKYFELLKDYGCENYFFNFEESNIQEDIKLFIKDDTYYDMKETISLNSEKSKKKSIEMWNKVFEILDSK